MAAPAEMVDPAEPAEAAANSLMTVALVETVAVAATAVGVVMAATGAVVRPSVFCSVAIPIPLWIL